VIVTVPKPTGIGFKPDHHVSVIGAQLTPVLFCFFLVELSRINHCFLRVEMNAQHKVPVVAVKVVPSANVLSQIGLFAKTMFAHRQKVFDRIVLATVWIVGL
jgi:hypothetical protein